MLKTVNVPQQILSEIMGLDDKEKQDILLELLAFSVCIKNKYGSSDLHDVSVRKVKELFLCGSDRARRLIENSKLCGYFRWYDNHVVARRLTTNEYKDYILESGKKKGQAVKLMCERVLKVRIKNVSIKNVIDELKKLFVLNFAKGKFASINKCLGSGGEKIALTLREVSGKLNSSLSSASRLLKKMVKDEILSVDYGRLERLPVYGIEEWLKKHPYYACIRFKEDVYVRTMNTYGLPNFEYLRRCVHKIFNCYKYDGVSFSNGELDSIANVEKYIEKLCQY